MTDKRITLCDGKPTRIKVTDPIKKALQAVCDVNQEIEKRQLRCQQRKQTKSH